MSAPEAPLKRTPLNQAHRAMGAKMVPFGGWDMPVQYSGILEEHRAVRTAAGLFDVSHMGEFLIAGPEALPALQRLITNDASRLGTGQVQYAALTYPNGTFVDDLTVYRLAGSEFMLTVNAANIPKDFAWIREHLTGRATATDLSDETGLLALQGPKAAEILQPLTPVDLKALKYYWFTAGRVAGIEARISRTGYTGEDGFEIYLPAPQAEGLWNALLERGKGAGLLPCGLGARDTLRLEAKMALYGNDIDDRHTVLEADLGWIVKWEKGEFLGREALARQKAEGVARKLAGFEMVGRGIARSHYKIVKEGRPIGEVTSGGPAPFLGKAIGLGYVQTPFSAVGTEFDVLIREQPVRARVVPTPFYKRPRT
ncbi:MAG: glycine cleavage system aminomethyltransferase GcvT [candidate division NC10 bacterium]|nr:glycine cleavage system aminomethyltransferase GcvT [candidate division NC10 bacterium]